MPLERSRRKVTQPKKQEPKPESPLSFKSIVGGIIVTVLGGIILAYIIQDAKFSSNRIESATTPTSIRTPSTISTLAPNSSQVTNSSTVAVSVEDKNTVGVFDGDLFISVKFISIRFDTVDAIIGSPGCVNQEIKNMPIGSVAIYECGKKYDIRVGAVKWRNTSIYSAEFYVTELEN